jgi:hypothetical protein
MMLRKRVTTHAERQVSMTVCVGSLHAMGCFGARIGALGMITVAVSLAASTVTAPLVLMMHIAPCERILGVT